MKPSLRYFGTGDEVREGDRIEYTSLFLRRKRPGTVVCIPPKTALELDDEQKPPDDWLIRFDDGTYTVVVSNVCSSVTSTDAILNVGLIPFVVTPPDACRSSPRSHSHRTCFDPRTRSSPHVLSLPLPR